MEYCDTCKLDTNHGGYEFCPSETKAKLEAALLRNGELKGLIERLKMEIGGRSAITAGVQHNYEVAMRQNRELQDKLALVEKMNADNAKMRAVYLDEKARAERLNDEAKLLLSAASEDFCENNCDFKESGTIEDHSVTCQQITDFLQGKTEKRFCEKVVAVNSNGEILCGEPKPCSQHR